MSSDVVLVVVQSRWEGDSSSVNAYPEGHTVFKTEIQLVRLGFPEEDGLRLELPLTMSLGNVKVTGSSPPRDYRNTVDDCYTSPFIHDESAERIVYLVIADQFLFISVQKLLRILSDHCQTAPAIAPPQLARFRWSEWGPDATFWLPTEGLSASWVSVDGARFMALCSYRRRFSTDEDGYVTSTKLNIERDPHDYRRILMLDFNPRPIRRDMKQGEGKQRKAERIQEWRRRSPLFDQEVVSRLPFRVSQGLVAGIPIALVVGMDHLVVTTVSLNLARKLYLTGY